MKVRSIRGGRRTRTWGSERPPPPPAAGGREWAVDAIGGSKKKSLRPARRRELAEWFPMTLQVSCLRACRLAQFSRAS
jgi:hypothetical protein